MPTTAKPGDLLDLLTLQKPVTERNEYGEDIKRWESVADRFASVEDMPARERWFAKRVELSPSLKVTMRREDELAIDETWRFLWEGNALHIAGFVRTRDFVFFDCEQVNGR